MSRSDGMYSHTFSGRRASQMQDELGPFIDFLIKNNVTRYLEIGSRNGDTFHEVMRHLPKGSFGVAVDLPGGLWGKTTTKRDMDAAIVDLHNKGYDVQVIYGDSKDAEIVKEIKDFGSFGAVLIDGDHTYEGVSADWQNYGSLAPLVAFHDIVGYKEYEKVTKRRVEVPKLWNEIKNEKSIEFIARNSRMGIGVYDAHG